MLNDQMPYSSVVRSYDLSGELDGCVVQAYHQEYSFVALLLNNEEVIAFAVEEASVGKWFEVFPICRYSVQLEHCLPWTKLEEPFVVNRSELMWREEWLEPGKDISGLLGSGPHYTQYVSALGASPQSSTNVVKVLAGVRLVNRREKSLVICSSDNAPFKIDFLVDPDEIQQAMQFHTCE
ncbi:MAG: hypothetical protein EON58_07840 [Alphaproteobacteria bacterium]|nr:MAG: hypothetical protein EON58_07840 [Alphaproteobacteria bacterium]